jgi:hypothetical protein
MATQASSVWRYRTGGNAANGAGYDAGIFGAGTDYSQQDAAQLTLSDVACSNTTTVTSATGGFTAAMIGNAFRITGGGSTTGYYWITARASTNSITVDRSPGTVTAGSGRVGGACTGDPGNLGAAAVPGNIVYLRATAGNAASYPTTGLDYTISAYFTPTSGDATNGYVRWVGENGVPTIGTPGLGFYSANFNSFEGLYLVATSNASGSYGLVSGNNLRWLACVANLNLQAGQVGINSTTPTIEGGEVYGGGTSPTASAGCYGINIIGGIGSLVRAVNVHHCRDSGIYDQGNATQIANNRSWRNIGDGILATSSSSSYPGAISGNTVDGNGGHGISVTAVDGVAAYEILNNEITNQLGAGKYGINVADGTLAQNDRRKRSCDYNNLYNNTAAYNAISAGPHALAVDPGYAAVATGDFTPSNAATQAAL